MHSFRSASKNSQSAKLARYGSGGSNVGSGGNSSKKIASGKPATRLKTGGKVSGEKGKDRGDKKKRGYDDGGAINTVGEEKKKEMNNSLAGAATKNPADGLNSAKGSNTNTGMDADTAAKVKNALTGMKKGGTAKAKRKWGGGGIDVNNDFGGGGGGEGGMIGAPIGSAIPSLGSRPGRMMNQGVGGTSPGGMPRAPMAPGMKKGGRTGLARGGRAKDKTGTKINITIGETGKEPPQMIPVPKPIPVPIGGPGGPGLPPGGPPPGAGGPPILPPGIGPGGPPPGLPIMPRASGGRTNMPHLTAGAGSGEGRMQKMHKTIPKRK
jgi:hypothetical protein